jgi:flagellar hook-associated protein 1 FlgK
MLRPTFLSFETARRTITAAQLGLDTVGHNTANINTPGYSRQRVDQVSFAMGGTGRFATFGKQLPGQGTLVTGINRVRDPFLDNRFRLETTNVGETSIKNFTMREMNRIFDEIEQPGLNAKFAELNDAFLKLQQSPSTAEHALVVRTYTQQLAQMMNKYAKDINNVETQLYSDFAVEITDMNTVLRQISFLNESIFQQNVYGNPANEMLDERDLLFDRLASFTDIVIVRKEIKISDARSAEQIEIRMNGLDGPVLLDHDKHVEFRLPADRQPPSVLDSDSYTIEMYDFNGNRASRNAGRMFERGAIRGYLDMLNGKGNFAETGNFNILGENSTRGIPYYRAAFDQLAIAFVREMNWANAADSDIFDAAFEINRLISHLNSSPTTVEDADNAIDAFIAARDNVPGLTTELNAQIGDLQAAIRDSVPPDPETTIAALNALRIALGNIDTSAFDPDQLEAMAELTGSFEALSILVEDLAGQPDIPSAIAELRDHISALDPQTQYSAIHWLTLALDEFEAEFNDQEPPYDIAALMRLFDNTIKQAIGDNIKPLLQFDDPARPSETIGITTAWRDDPMYLTRYVDEMPVGVDRFIQLLTMQTYDFPNGTEGSNIFLNGTFQQYLVSFMAEMALDLNIYHTLYTAADKSLNTLAGNREAVSGVSMNEESINLMNYQNYYNAALRYMTAIDEALDQLINRMGVVGR